MIQRFRKVPIIVDAIQFKQTYQNAQEIIDWINAETKFDPLSGQDPPVMYYYGDLTIRTLDGDMHASKDDWIVKGDAGEFYPVKPDIFERTHKLVQPVVSSDTMTDWGDGDWCRYLESIDRNEND